MMQSGDVTTIGMATLNWLVELLWITEENDTHDIVLGPGDVWMVESDGLTIIEAQNDASFRALGRSFDRAWKAARAGPWWSRVLDSLVPSTRRHVPYY